jgi:membrane-bound ClpP family serine protease
MALLALLLFRISKASGADSPDDPSGMVGEVGVAQGTFAADGLILARGELWRATSSAGIVQQGDEVVVQGVGSGLVLIVKTKKVERI